MVMFVGGMDDCWFCWKCALLFDVLRPERDHDDDAPCETRRVEGIMNGTGVVIDVKVIHGFHSVEKGTQPHFASEFIHDRCSEPPPTVAPVQILQRSDKIVRLRLAFLEWKE